MGTEGLNRTMVYASTSSSRVRRRVRMRRSATAVRPPIFLPVFIRPNTQFPPCHRIPAQRPQSETHPHKQTPITS